MARSNAVNANGVRRSGYANRSAAAAPSVNAARAPGVVPDAVNDNAQTPSAASRNQRLNSGAPTANGTRPRWNGGTTIQIATKNTTSAGMSTTSGILSVTN